MSKLILGIETATKICSVAISKGDETIVVKEEGGEYSHAEKLNGFIEYCLSEAGITLADIDAIAVSKGPGSYTGLRIGVSTAKGLCYSLNKPLIAVETLQAMALKMSSFDNSAENYCPMIDARRMEVYTAIYNKDNQKIEDISAKIIDSESYHDILSNKSFFFGDGADKCREILKNYDNAIISDVGTPSAEFVNKIAFKKYLKGEFEDVAYFEPYYLKDFIATTAKKLL
jgi:tRNA threonylcarbamoyladenosine biosynthesis protein TsaB